MRRFARWQWQWRSRRRLFGIGTAIMLLGLLVIVPLLLSDKALNPNAMRAVAGGLMLTGIGGYKILQATFSGSGAFGEED